MQHIPLSLPTHTPRSHAPHFFLYTQPIISSSCLFNLRVAPCISEQVVYPLSFPQSSLYPLAHAMNISINSSITVEGIWLLSSLKEKDKYRSNGRVAVPPPVVHRWRKMCIFHCYVTLWNTSIQRHLNFPSSQWMNNVNVYTSHRVKTHK